MAAPDATFASVTVPAESVVAVLPAEVVTSPVNAGIRAASSVPLVILAALKLGMSESSQVLLVEIFDLAIAALAAIWAFTMLVPTSLVPIFNPARLVMLFPLASRSLWRRPRSSGVGLLTAASNTPSARQVAENRRTFFFVIGSVVISIQ